MVFKARFGLINTGVCIYILSTYVPHRMLFDPSKSAINTNTKTNDSDSKKIFHPQEEL